MSIENVQHVLDDLSGPANCTDLFTDTALEHIVYSDLIFSFRVNGEIQLYIYGNTKIDVLN